MKGQKHFAKLHLTKEERSRDLYLMACVHPPQTHIDEELDLFTLRSWLLQTAYATELMNVPWEFEKHGISLGPLCWFKGASMCRAVRLASLPSHIAFQHHQAKAHIYLSLISFLSLNITSNLTSPHLTSPHLQKHAIVLCRCLGGPSGHSRANEAGPQILGSHWLSSVKLQSRPRLRT